MRWIGVNRFYLPEGDPVGLEVGFDFDCDAQE